jgi:hypothetical protein
MHVGSYCERFCAASGMTMARNQVSFEELAQLELHHDSNVELLRSVLEQARTVKSMLRHLRVDINRREQTDRDWLKEFDEACNALWDSCRAAQEQLSTPSRRPELPSITEPVIQALKDSHELVLADNACILGRSGCENRWDKAMHALKQSLTRVRE